MPKNLHKVANGKLWMLALYLITSWWLAEVLITPPSSYHVLYWDSQISLKVHRFKISRFNRFELFFSLSGFCWIFFCLLIWMTFVLFSSLSITELSVHIFWIVRKEEKKNKNKWNKFHLSLLMPAHLVLLRGKLTHPLIWLYISFEVFKLFPIKHQLTLKYPRSWKKKRQNLYWILNKNWTRRIDSLAVFYHICPRSLQKGLATAAAYGPYRLYDFLMLNLVYAAWLPFIEAELSFHDMCQSILPVFKPASALNCSWQIAYAYGSQR